MIFFGKRRTTSAPYMLILYSVFFLNDYWYFHEISMFENYVGISHHLKFYRFTRNTIESNAKIKICQSIRIKH